MALPPGPALPAALALVQFLARPTETFEGSFRRYGDLYSVNNPLYGREVVVSDPELLKGVFTGDPEVFRGGEPNRTLRPLLGDRSVLLLDGAEHHRHRKLLMPPFRGERLSAYRDTMRTITERVIATWPRGKRFSLLPSMQRITFEVILQTVFGVRDGADVASLRDRLLAVVERAQSPVGMLMLLPLFQRNLGPLTPWAAFERELGAADACIYELIARARSEAGRPTEASRGASRRNDVLSLLLAAVDEEGRGLTDAELRDELLTLLIAGYETTATALCWAVDEIFRRPAVHAKVLDEVTRAADDGPTPYLDATIKEVLRLRPLAPLLVRKLAHSIHLRDYEIPAGTVIVPCVYMAQRHPAYWDAPEVFRPERFLEGKPPHPYAWLPFGGGARRCIGMALALDEMRVVLSTILPRVTLRPTDRRAKVALRSFLFAPAGGTRVVVEPAATA